MILKMRRMVPVAVLAASLVVASCSGGVAAKDAPKAPTPAEEAIPWSAPSDPMERARAAGLEPANVEHLAFHVHAHLDVFVNGKHVSVPAGIGIAIDDPAVQKLSSAEFGTGYGRIPPSGCSEACVSPLHTHFADGILHTEAQGDQPNTLGEFFTEWGVTLNDRCVGGYCEPDAVIQVFVDGDPYTTDPANIELTDHREIAIVIGTPPAQIPSDADFSNA